MNKEQMKWSAEMLSKSIEQEKEIERLNNIINELDTFLKNKIDNFKEDVKDTILHEQITISIIYDYLQELKGDESNG